MKLALIRSTAAAVLLGSLALTAPAMADDPAPAPAALDADAARLSATGHSVKWNWVPPGRSARYGHAETLIHAPLAAVRHLVVDYVRYRELAPSITTSRVVGHEPDGASDVYLAMGVLNNTISLWSVMRFAPLKAAPDGVEVVEGQMVPGKGNIDDSQLLWSMHAAGAEWTVLKLDLLLRPGVPAPQSLVDEQLRDSAMDAVNSVHDRAQGSRDFVPFSG